MVRKISAKYESTRNPGRNFQPSGALHDPQARPRHGECRALGLSAAPAFAAGPIESGNACQRSGMATVKSLGKGVFPSIAKSGVDAGTLKTLGVRGIDAVPDSTVFSLPQVLELHRTSPQLFPWCD